MNNLAPFVRVFTNTLGNGRWFDSFVNDLLPTVLGSAVCTGVGTTPLPVSCSGEHRMSGSLQRGVAFAAAIVLLAALGWTILKPAGQYRVTAYFTGTVGPLPGLRRPDPRHRRRRDHRHHRRSATRCASRWSIDDEYDIPADAAAVVLAPSLVSDRYVQFAPVYDGGPTMEDGAEVPLDRTGTPVELDQVYGALDDLSEALGPTGANENGALSDLVDVGAANLEGNGEALNRTLTGFSQAVETLATHRDDLFSSLDNLQVFTSALATIDAQVGQFNDNMAAVADLLRRRAGGPRAGVRAAQPGARPTSPGSSRTTPTCSAPT